MRRTISERISRIIEKEKNRLTNEIRIFENKRADVESYYGFNGPYTRIVKAIESREAKLEELKDVEAQFQKIKKHISVPMYVLGCQNCKTTFMTIRRPFDDWHECPTCRHMIMVKNPTRYTVSIEDDGQTWTEMIKQSLSDD